MKLQTFLLLGCLAAAQIIFAGDPLPEWTQGAVWYHIVPERFRNGNPQNDPTKTDVLRKDNGDWQVHPWASDWYKLQIWEANRHLPFDELVAQRRYGGDLLGVIEKLPYLKEFGVNVIYLSPIFESPSVLKYDASTFHHIDDNFGFTGAGGFSNLPPPRKNRLEKKVNAQEKHDENVLPETEDPATWKLTPSDEVFVQLLAKAHEQGMKVVITGVFHYVGEDFWAFRDLQEKQRESAYKDWFEVLSWDDPATPDTVEFDYKSWENDRRRPLFRQPAPAGKDEHGLAAPVKKYIFDCTRRWLDPNGDGDPRDGVDGWVVHEAHALAAPFLEEWAQFVKSINPQAIALAAGENGASAVANGFAIAASEAFTKTMHDFFVHQKYSLSEFHDKLEQIRKDSSAGHGVLHRLSDHHRDRIATIIRSHVATDSVLGEFTPGEYDPRKPDKRQRDIQKAMVFLQLTYPGAPMILYGDESGMWGGAQRDLIKPMLWREFVYEKETYSIIRPDLSDESENVVDGELLQFYYLLNKARRENAALQKGDYKLLLLDDQKNILAFARQFEKNEVVVVFNNSEERRTIEIAAGWKDDSKVKDGMKDEKYRVKNGVIKVELEKKTGTIVIKQK